MAAIKVEIKISTTSKTTDVFGDCWCMAPATLAT
jgi:hypothetical protein